MSRASSAVLVASLTIACGGDSTRPVTVAAVNLSQTSAQLTLGQTIVLVATPADGDGNALTGRTVDWSTNSPSVASVSSTGLVTALGAGVATITATSENVAADAQITVSIPVESVTLDRTTIHLAIGDSTQLVATTRDAQGGILTGRTITWGSTASAVASVSDTGWVKGIAAGVSTITATSESVTAQAQVTVGTAPVLSAISPPVLTPGATATITGTDFSLTAGDNTVTIDGVQSAVIGATATELTVLVPPASLFSCTATHNATIEVEVAGVSGTRLHPLQVATQHDLAVGEMIRFPTAAVARCNEFSQTGGRYFVAVSRPDNTIVTTSAFRFEGEGSTVLSAPVIAALADPTPPFSVTARLGASPPLPFSTAARRARADRHLRLLERNLAIGARPDLVRRRAPRTTASLSRSRISFDISTVGDTTTLKIPNIDLGSFCSSAPISVRARTVYAGPRAVILEDVDAPLAGTMDAQYQAIGQEFDDVMYPLVTSNFGDPLAFDDSLDANGKLIMLFSEQINEFGNVLGFVTSCDFFDTLATPAAIASNQAEIFYAVVPTDAGTTFDNNPSTYNPVEWRRDIRGTVIHETKHLAMFAERFSNANATTLEESWLEEGMAMHSEELYARIFSGAAWKGNTGYGSSSAPNYIWCEVRPSTAACADRPLLVTQAFAFLYDYLSDIENRTVAGSVPGDPNDVSFYGSAWAFVRWMIDAYATNEGAVLRALTTEPSLSGASNLAARSGVSYDEMLPFFHYALRYDDATGVTSSAPWQHIASWNFPNVFGGLHADFQTVFDADYLLDHPLQFGSFGININVLRGGTAAHFEISGTQTAKQVLVLQAQNGAAPDPALRMSVFRVQ